MLALIAGKYPVVGEKLLVTSSLGISIYADHGRDPGLLIRLADKTMYDARQAGRNGYRLSPGGELAIPRFGTARARTPDRPGNPRLARAVAAAPESWLNWAP